MTVLTAEESRPGSKSSTTTSPVEASQEFAPGLDGFSGLYSNKPFTTASLLPIV